MLKTSAPDGLVFEVGRGGVHVAFLKLVRAAAMIGLLGLAEVWRMRPDEMLDGFTVDWANRLGDDAVSGVAVTGAIVSNGGVSNEAKGGTDWPGVTTDTIVLNVEPTEEGDAVFGLGIENADAGHKHLQSQGVGGAVGDWVLVAEGVCGDEELDSWVAAGLGFIFTEILDAKMDISIEEIESGVGWLGACWVAEGRASRGSCNSERFAPII